PPPVYREHKKRPREGFAGLGAASWFVPVPGVELSLRESAMPLRDHFRPPVEKRHSWDELHGGWPMVIVQQLFPQLPHGFVAVPAVHLGAAFEIDVSTYEQDGSETTSPNTRQRGNAVAAVHTPQPTLVLETELADHDEYEVRIYDERHGR